MIHRVDLKIERLDSKYIWKDSTLYNDLKCLICKSIVFDPKICINCEKIYCQFCSRNVENKECNKCKKELVLKGINSNDELEFLNKIELKCANMDIGCPFIISYRNYQSHIEDCYHSRYKCVGKDCSYENMKQKVLIHVLSCNYVLVECVKCRSSVRRIDLENHLRECKLNLVFCPYCKLELTKNDFFDFKDHSCSERIITNKYQNVNHLKKTILIDFEHLKEKLLRKEQKLQNKSEFLLKKRKLLFQIKYKQKIRRKKILIKAQSNFDSFNNKKLEEIKTSKLKEIKSQIDHKNILNEYRKVLNSIINKNSEILNNKKKYF